MDINTTRNQNGNGAADSAKDFVRDASSAAQNLGAATKKAAHDVGSVARDEASKLRADLDDLISKIPGLSEIDLQVAKEKFLATVNSVSASAKNYVADAREKITEQVEVTESFIKEKPFKSVGIAAIAGLLVGALVARRRS